jgi:hypothetical protein
VANLPIGFAMPLSATYSAIRDAAEDAAGGPCEVYQRLGPLRAIEQESAGNQVFPAAALHDRPAFVRFYTDFYFSKQCGHLPGAHAFVDGALLALLNRLHAAAAAGHHLAQAERWALFSTACSVYGQARAEAAFAG